MQSEVVRPAARVVLNKRLEKKGRQLVAARLQYASQSLESLEVKASS
jgi:hypothetical protein